MVGETVARDSEEAKDQLFADGFKERGQAVGLYVECGGIKEKNGTVYYALVMSQTEYDQQLAEENEQRRLWHEDRLSKSPYSTPPFEASTMLSWEATVSQPTFRGGYDFRYQALIDSAKPFLRPGVFQ